MSRLLIFGFGYSGQAVAAAVPEFAITATSRAAAEAAQDIAFIPFDEARAAIAAATHILVTAPPGTDGDPVLTWNKTRHGPARSDHDAEEAPLVSVFERAGKTPVANKSTDADGFPGEPPGIGVYAAAIAAAPALRWIGYLSSTVVYGDRGGAWVDEDTPAAPSQPRGQRRLAAEIAWSQFADRCAVDIFRLAGIYGPGRSAFDDLRAGTARRMIKPGHQFGRIHRDDIGRAVAAAMRQSRGPGRRVLNLADDVPSESEAVVTEAARLMGIPPPPPTFFADALPAMSPMARSFWAENRKVGSRKTQRALGLRWLYPSFREGLAAIWREEGGDGSPQHVQVARP